jgi:D-cysteine desulfhydrase family pyridoxal phosphate-dependent enzyme
MLTDHLARVSLAHLPTPVEEMTRLREQLGGGPRLLIKRDDQTGLATGGNKTRKLEFLAGEALAQGADILVTVGGPQSNHCRQTAAAAAKLGLRCALVLSGSETPRLEWNGNLLLDELLGAGLYWSGERAREAVAEEVVNQLRSSGASPYFIPVGGSVPIGAAGYVAAVEELNAQLDERHMRVDRIVFSSGSAGTHSGILVGVKALHMSASVEGIHNDKVGGLSAKVRTLSASTADHLGLDLQFKDSDVVLHEVYGASGYGVITDAEREAIRILARTEGIIADPVYTGRALAGLIDMVRTGAISPDETVLFWHTGGVAGLFARPVDMLAA